MLLLLCFFAILEYEALITGELSLGVNLGAKTCMNDVGCFEITADFSLDDLRPVNVLPQPREIINTAFHLYTKSNPNNECILVANNISIKSCLNSSEQLAFIVPGFEGSNEVWLKQMKDALLSNTAYSVVIVDWSGGDGFPYFQAAANARVVGAEIAHLISMSEEVVDITPQDCYIIGHSLGAHIAGYAGERLKNLRRITALDPAGPYFQYLPAVVRIDWTDADFVDVIHTDSSSFHPLGLGMMQSVGHVDFYPNGGIAQPGCHTTYAKKLAAILRRLALSADEMGLPGLTTCEHERAIQLFMSSINLKGNVFVGIRCPNWDDYQKGECSSCGQDGKDCAVMGMHADKHIPGPSSSNNRFSIETSGLRPFFVNNYVVVMHFGIQTGNSVEGKVKLRFNDGNGGKIEVVDKKLLSSPGQLTKFLITSPLEILSHEILEFCWESSSLKSLLFKFYIDIKDIKIFKISEGENSVVTYHPMVAGPFKSKQSVQMTRQNKCTN